MRILLTGFQPFGDLQVNPSQLIIQHFQTHQRDDVISMVLPTAYKAAGESIENAVQTHHPDAIIMLGVAQSRTAISLERIAVNIDDAKLPDNAEVVASGERIASDGPAAYWSTLPLAAMQAALEARAIPAAISNHAGTFVCNHVFYVARHALESIGRSIPCGFIHVPALAENANQPGLPLETMIQAVGVCLDVLQALLKVS